MSTVEVSTQEAADLLKVFHPALMQMLDAGALDFCMVGTERRVRVESLMAHLHKLDSDRRSALTELSAYDQTETDGVMRLLLPVERFSEWWKH